MILRRIQNGRKVCYFFRQRIENNLTNICIFCIASWYYADGINTDVKYRCLRMLDWLVSTHPISGV